MYTKQSNETCKQDSQITDWTVWTWVKYLRCTWYQTRKQTVKKAYVVDNCKKENGYIWKNLSHFDEAAEDQVVTAEEFYLGVWLTSMWHVTATRRVFDEGNWTLRKTADCGVVLGD